ncbi:hypothetical protein ABZ388_27305 [Micromonospora parva]|uniref:hypothetical protein n=1 Tax=Micromonospora parva TaxID=1464048 RepID=UPI0033E92605
MTITTLGSRFLAAFNDIEKHIRGHLKADERISFTQLAREYAEKKRLPSQHKSALVAFASLRNAIATAPTTVGGRSRSRSRRLSRRSSGSGS